MKIIWYLVVLTTGILLFSCTENNLFDNEINVTENLIVRGTVLLSDPTGPDSVYVWMEGVNLSTYTDAQGDFLLELPSPKNQPGGGLNGIYRIFFFLGNYRIESASTLIINGEFQYGKGDLDIKGNVTRKVVLHKLLDIRTVVSPSEIENTYKDSIVTRIQLVNVTDTVRVRTFKRITGYTSCLIIKPVRGTDEQAVLLRGDPTFWWEEIITEPTEWIMIYKFISGFFEPGEYEFFPFLEVVQDGVPPGLLESLGNDVYAFGHEYLKVPFKQVRGRLKVSGL